MTIDPEPLTEPLGSPAVHPAAGEGVDPADLAELAELDHGPEPVFAWVCEDSDDILTGDVHRLARQIELAYEGSYGAPVSVCAVRDQQLVHVSVEPVRTINEGDWATTVYEARFPDGSVLATFVSSVDTTREGIRAND